MTIGTAILDGSDRDEDKDKDGEVGTDNLIIQQHIHSYTSYTPRMSR